MVRQRVPSRIFRTLAVAGAAALMLTSCATAGGSGSSPRDASPDEDPAVPALTEENLLGTWGSTDEREPHLTFDEGGTLAGSDGCNRLVGGWSLADETVSLENLAGTLMACEGVDTWLREAVSAVLLDDDELSVRNGDGDEIGTLERDD